MPAIGLAEASRISGKNRSTIHRAMQTGRLSYSKTEDGERRIDVAELERVFGKLGVPGFDGATAGNGAAPLQSHSAQPGEVASLLAVIETLCATVADLNATIRLQQDEKRALLALLTGPDRRPWWRRWWR